MRTDRKYRLFAIGLFLLCSVAMMAQLQSEMSSTSAMLQNDNASYCTRNVEAVMSSGSAYSSSVEMPHSPAYAPSGRRRVSEKEGDDDIPFPDPIGDAVWPLLALASVYALLRVYRRKRSV